MNQAKDLDFHWWRFGGGITFYPYQVGLGVSLQYWPCIFAPAIRIHIGPIKFWGYISLKQLLRGKT